MSDTPQTDANLSADGLWVPAFVVRQMERHLDAHQKLGASAILKNVELGRGVAALEAERDRAKKSENTWKEIAGTLDRIHTQANQRITELEAALNEIYHSTSCTTQQMEIINEVLPQVVA